MSLKQVFADMTLVIQKKQYILLVKALSTLHTKICHSVTGVQAQLRYSSCDGKRTLSTLHTTTIHVRCISKHSTKESDIKAYSV